MEKEAEEFTSSAVESVSLKRFNEDHSQLNIPFREKAYKGKSVHEDLVDALITLRTEKDPDKYYSKEDPTDELEKVEDKVFSDFIFNSDDENAIEPYVWDFANTYDPNDNEDHAMYVQHELDEVSEDDEDTFSTKAAKYGLSTLLSAEGKEAILKERDRFYDESNEMRGTIEDSYKNDDNGLIDCWRTVSYTKGDAKSLYHNIVQNYKGVGVYWAWDEKKAEAYWGESGGHHITLHGQVSVENVNWYETLFRSIYGLRDEHEIRLKDGGSIKIVGFTDETIDKYIPLEEPMVVKVGHS